MFIEELTLQVKRTQSPGVYIASTMFMINSTFPKAVLISFKYL